MVDEVATAAPMEHWASGGGEMGGENVTGEEHSEC